MSSPSDNNLIHSFDSSNNSLDNSYSSSNYSSLSNALINEPNKLNLHNNDELVNLKNVDEEYEPITWLNSNKCTKKIQIKHDSISDVRDFSNSNDVKIQFKRSFQNTKEDYKIIMQNNILDNFACFHNFLNEFSSELISLKGIHT